MNFSYNGVMSALLDHALETLRTLPPEMQDDLARIVLQLAGEEQPTVHLSAEEIASLSHSLAQAERGEFVSNEQVTEMWAKYKK